MIARVFWRGLLGASEFLLVWATCLAHVSVEKMLGGAHMETMKAWKREGMRWGPSSALQLTQLANGAGGGDSRG